MSLPLINSYTSWAPLEEVWLGDVYPAAWYDHLPSEVRDCFYEVTEKTQQDLEVIHRKLEELGALVISPEHPRSLSQRLTVLCGLSSRI